MGAHVFAHRLLTLMSIYAFSLESGAAMHTPERFDRGILKFAHRVYAHYLGKKYRANSLLAWRPPVHLPPTAPLGPEHRDKTELYFFGWVFRNPVGMEKYRTEILKKFTPPSHIIKELDARIAPLTTQVRIGLHIRQTPYPGFPEGKFLVSPERTRQILEEYLREKNIEKKDAVLYIATDQPLQTGVFEDMQCIISTDEQFGFYLLGKSHVVIGTNSTSANLSAWYANVPHIVATDTPVDWAYYKDKKNYFESKYATCTHP